MSYYDDEFSEEDMGYCDGCGEVYGTPHQAVLHNMWLDEIGHCTICNICFWGCCHDPDEEPEG